MKTFVKLLKNTLAEGQLFPAGTICEMEQSYPAEGEQQAMLDLIEPESESLFWVFTDDVEFIDERSARKRDRYLVGFYNIDMSYGGPEEGGWWYNTGQLVRPVKIFANEEAAYNFASRANRLLEHLERHKRQVSSVIYDGSRHQAEVYTNELPAFYPSEQPHYE